MARTPAVRRVRPLLLAALGLTLLLLPGALLPGLALAQSVSIDLGPDGALTPRLVQLFAIVTVLSLAPGVLMMVTCFPFMVTVLSILRQAIGVQQAPPNMMIVSLALFLTFFVMAPVFDQAWRDGIAPYMDGDITEQQAIDRTVAPFRTFMEARVKDNHGGLMLKLARARVDEDGHMPLSALLPAFMITEIERAFQFGFVIFLPFLVIDIVVASILMAMGMIMVPPVMVALPFKLAFFTVSNGWDLIAGSMVGSYGG
ncbi:MAG: flagellar type III secretion system pore protein FliP [Alphaproteobacteria bacterium]|nr:flagellar type III secretion system pore protein FliP [Alphaproteobacteria bacterium]MCB9928767.1 flagellar type III secretion system pore protein FliP [Alphaproteobacteria bacterium]